MSNTGIKIADLLTGI